MQEFDVIKRYFDRPNDNLLVDLGVGDDAALLTIPADMQLVSSIDTLVSGTHFLSATAPEDIAYKSLAVSLSDMAAMGAEPFSVLLALTLPKAEPSWLQAFAKGFFSLADYHALSLIGGDTTAGPLAVSTVVNGLVRRHQALCRSGAKPGDLIYVTGCLGDAGCALAILQDTQTSIDPYLLRRLERPTPRVAVGKALGGLASAAIDISDGLLADLTKLLQASHCGAVLDFAALPLSAQLLSNSTEQQALAYALTAGDDYELCFTLPKARQAELAQRLNKLGAAFTLIGEVKASPEILANNDKYDLMKLANKGYEHFRDD